MRPITIEDKEYITIKLVQKLRGIPSYNPKINGVKATYLPRIHLILSAPFRLHLPLTPFQFSKLITETFSTYGYSASGLVVYMSYPIIKKKNKPHKRKCLNVIIRRLKRLEKSPK